MIKGIPSTELDMLFRLTDRIENKKALAIN